MLLVPNYNELQKFYTISYISYIYIDNNIERIGKKFMRILSAWRSASNSLSLSMTLLSEDMVIKLRIQ